MKSSEKRINTIARKKLRNIFDNFYCRNQKQNKLIFPKELIEFILETKIENENIGKEIGLLYNNKITIV